jgi:hypothetical protein
MILGHVSERAAVNASLARLRRQVSERTGLVRTRARRIASLLGAQRQRVVAQMSDAESRRLALVEKAKREMLAATKATKRATAWDSARVGMLERAVEAARRDAPRRANPVAPPRMTGLRARYNSRLNGRVFDRYDAALGELSGRIAPLRASANAGRNAAPVHNAAARGEELPPGVNPNAIAALASELRGHVWHANASDEERLESIKHYIGVMARSVAMLRREPQAVDVLATSIRATIGNILTEAKMLPRRYQGAIEHAGDESLANEIQALVSMVIKNGATTQVTAASHSLRGFLMSVRALKQSMQNNRGRR